MTNTTAAIMAIPKQMDSVRLVGDEEKHATLLFFGETSTLPDEAKQNLLTAVEMATSLVFPFRESVVDVKRLGSDNPPALVAMLSNDCIGQVRNLFMMNTDVETYLGNTPQFPSFTPHVTLAHPDFPDEAIIRTLMRLVYQIQFDRLAVWWNDERIEFPITGPPIPQDSQDSPSLAMSSLIEKFLVESEVEEGLEHHGVRGQKWGVTKERDGGNHSVFVATGAKPQPGETFKSGGTEHTVVRATTRASDGKHVVVTQSQKQAELGAKLVKIVKKDKEYWQKAAAVAGVGALGLAAAAVAPALLPASVVLAAGGPAITASKIALGTGIATRLGYSHNYLQYTRRTRAAKALTHADVSSEKSVGDVYDELSPSKKTAANLLIAAYSQRIEFADDPIIQSGWASMTPTERSVVLFLASGVDLKPEISHSDVEEVPDAIDIILKHHGIRGQKWGIRRNKDTATGRVEQTGSTGLKPRTGSADQIVQDRIQKKIDTVGVHALSNTELQAYTRRLNMEKDVNKALSDQSAATQAKADGFIKGFIKKQGGRQADRFVNKALDVAFEAAVKQAGVKLEGNNPAVGKGLQEVAGRMKPKKGK